MKYSLITCEVNKYNQKGGIKKKVIKEGLYLWKKARWIKGNIDRRNVRRIKFLRHQ